MECVGVFLVLVIGCAIILSVVGGRIGRRRRRRRLFQLLARQFSGIHDAGGLFSTPRIRIPYGATTATIQECFVLGPFREAAFQVCVSWPHAHVRCEIIATAGNRLTLPTQFAWPRIPLDRRELSHPVVVNGFDESDVSQLLSSGVCWQLERLRAMGNDQRLYVLIRDGQIIAQKYWRRPRSDQPAQFVQGVLELYDQCMLAKASGIEFLYSEEAQTLESVICKICGDSIEEDLVYCRRCKTPHHQDCWCYTGACSVFGCRETVYLLPQRGFSLPAPESEPRLKKPR